MARNRSAITSAASACPAGAQRMSTAWNPGVPSAPNRSRNGASSEIAGMPRRASVPPRRRIRPGDTQPRPDSVFIRRSKPSSFRRSERIFSM